MRVQIHWNGKQLNLGSFILESFELFVLLTKIIDEIYVAISETIAQRSNLHCIFFLQIQRALLPVKLMQIELFFGFVGLVRTQIPHQVGEAARSTKPAGLLLG